MADLLIRNCAAETKRALAVRAAQNGRSQQGEALLDELKSWIDLMLENSRTVGGVEFEPPHRHAPRLTVAALQPCATSSAPTWPRS